MSIPAFNLVPGSIDINTVVGDDFALLLEFKDEDGDPVDLTGYTFDGRILLDNSPSNRYQALTIINTNLAQGRVTIGLTDTQTIILGPLSSRKWFLTWTVGADTRTVLSGKFTLNPKWGVTDYSPTSSPVTVTIQEDTLTVTVIGGSGGIVQWGDIGGDIENQTDLQEALDSKLTAANNLSDLPNDEQSRLNLGVPYGASDYTLVFEGDSITFGYGVTTSQRFSEIVANDPRLSEHAAFTNCAASGNVLSDIVSQYSTEVYPYRPSAQGTLGGYLFVEIGTNDIYFNNISNVNTYFASLVSYWQNAQSDGFQVIAFTICTRDSFTTAQEAIRIQLNELIRSSKIWNKIVDMDSILPDWSDTANFQDGVHPTVAGHYKIGTEISDMLVTKTKTAGYLSLPYVHSRDNRFQKSQTITGNVDVRPTSFDFGLVDPTIFELFITRYFTYRSDPTAPSDAHIWWYGTNNGQFQIGCANDLKTVFNAALIMERSGATPGLNTFTGPLAASNLSGTNTGDQYGGVTSSSALTFLRRNAANNGYEFGPVAGSGANLTGVVLTTTSQSVAGSKVFIDPIYSTTISSASGVVVPVGMVFQTGISQSGTAGYDVISMDVVETSTGSGQKSLMRLRVGGVEQFLLSSTGNLTIAGNYAGANLSGTNTGDQYGGVTASGANQYLRRNGAGTAYEFGNKTDYLTTTPTTGQTVSFNDNSIDQLMRINPSGDLADLTVDIPSNSTSINTQKVIFMCTKNVTNLTLTGAATIFNAPVSMNAGDCFQFYKSASDEWTRVIT